MVAILFLCSCSIIGVVSPFALGSVHPSSTSISSVNPANNQNQNHNNIHNHFRPRSLALTPDSHALDAAAKNNTATTKGSRRIRNWLSLSNRKQPQQEQTTKKSWKGGEESKSSLISRLLFWYVGPLLDLAQQRTLQETDSFELAEENTMKHSVDALASSYQKVKQNGQTKLQTKAKSKNKTNTPTSISTTLSSSSSSSSSSSWWLVKALVQHQKQTLILTGILRFLNTAVQAFPAILLSRLLKCIEAGNTIPLNKALLSAFSLIFVLNLKMIIENQFFHKVVSMSTQTRGAIEGLVFDKSLRLPGGGASVLATKEDNNANPNEFPNETNDSKSRSRSRGNSSSVLGSGGVLNLMQSDATTIESAAMQIHTIWDGPLQIALYTTLLFRYLGKSVFWGIAVLLTVIPLNSITLRVLDRLSRYEIQAKDARTKRTTESIKNMKLLKVQGWESKFADDIRGHRTDELDRHKTRGIVRALNSAISNAVPALVLVVTLTAYARTGQPIVASTIFTAISLFNQLRYPLFFYPMLIDSLANGKNALRRISSYLNSEELTPYVQQKQQQLPQESNHAIDGGSIEMKNGNFLWSTSQAPKDGEVTSPESPALCNVNLKVNPGEVVAVVGPVGSGKSALIKGLLGELAPVPRMVVDNQGIASSSSSSSTTSMVQEWIDKPSVLLNGNVAYCSQEAWLPKGTLRDAVIFGRDYDEGRYLAAIRDAGLDNDIVSNVELLSDAANGSGGLLSHDTDVGEGGSSLSGGQRARVALARALYSGADTKIFLLDDCLAALDARVGSLVFERVTRRLRASNAATVIVTNDPSLPRRCDRVVLMGPTDGNMNPCSTIADTGTYDELLARGHKLESFSSVSDEMLAASKGQEKDNGPTKTKRQPEIVRIVAANDSGLSYHTDPEFQPAEVHESPNFIADGVIPVDTEDEVTPSRVSNATTDAELSVSSDKRKNLVSADEKMSTKAVPLSTYIGYLKSIRSPALICAMLAAFGTSTGAQFFQQYTVMKWTELAHGDAMVTALGTKYLRSLIGAAGVVSVALWLRSFLTMLVGTRASAFYHERMVSSVFRAPMSFFDSTPSGQILSRFGKEMYVIDRNLPDSYASVLFCALQISSSAAALVGAITPAMTIPLIFSGSLYLKTMKKFRPAARDMKRSETKTRSPIFTHFGEALRGTEIIRSIPGAAKSWSATHRTLSDTNLSVYSTVKALDRWLSCSLENLGNFMVLTAAIASVFLSRAGLLKPGAAGWGLTQSLAITGLMAWAIRNLTMLESHMMSVMRVKELTDLDSEEANLSPLADGTAPKSIMQKELAKPGEALEVLFPETNHLNVTVAPLTEKALLADGWPWKGGVSFKNVSMRYNPESPLVLKDVTISVPPGSTLGVVGRTGSGKSSLLLTLFRIIEIEKGGRIDIDGVDIRSISIPTLRENLSIIPQDPVLFAGSLAYNLDATGKASAEEMLEALNASSPELIQQISATGGLDTEIAEGGSNLSSGQRQLICLARALIRKSKILVLDEATSSVDARTDQKVQDTIRTEFVDKGVTVITVAHRLDTVLGYDKIVVLGDGCLLEYGSPSELLKIPNGELRQLVDADRRNKRKGGKKMGEEGPVAA